MTAPIRYLDLGPYLSVCEFYERRIDSLSTDQADRALTTLQNHHRAMTEERDKRWRAFRAHQKLTLAGIGKVASAYLAVARLVNRYDALIAVFEAISSGPDSSPDASGRSD
jgi:hypothetical protein